MSMRQPSPRTWHPRQELARWVAAKWERGQHPSKIHSKAGSNPDGSQGPAPEPRGAAAV